MSLQQLKLLHPSFESGNWGVGQIGHVAQRQWAPVGEGEQLQRCRLAGRVRQGGRRYYLHLFHPEQGVAEMAKRLGWQSDLENLIKGGQKESGKSSTK